jgi:hypothetical protein
MVRKNLKKFIDSLEMRRAKKEGGTGTIWLKSMQEFHDVCDYFEGAVLSPGGAAGELGVSRAMIHLLEKEGKIRAYRFIPPDDELDDEPYWVRVLFGVKRPYIWIPIEDIVRYAKEVGRDKRPSIQNYADLLEKRKKK